MSPAKRPSRARAWPQFAKEAREDAIGYMQMADRCLQESDEHLREAERAAEVGNAERSALFIEKARRCRVEAQMYIEKARHKLSEAATMKPPG